MRDLAFVAFLAAFLAFGLKRPFLFVLAYAYVDIVSPQRLSYYLLNSVPLSMILAALAIGGWVVNDLRHGARPAGRQWLMLVLLGYAAWTTVNADVPDAAAEKWAWAWKSMFWAAFLPFALRTKLRIEAYLLTMVLSASAIIITGGIKTVLAGGGYGALNLMIDDNSGLYEGSTIACVAIAIIPLILWLARFGTIFPSDWRVRLFAGALVFACLLMPVGTEARTGLVCIAVLAVLTLRHTRHRLLYMGALGLVAMAAVPFLPSSFSDRMGTIQTYQADQSASTRLAVWGWTWNYVQDKPMGGGFDNYLLNRVDVSMAQGTGGITARQSVSDAGRAYHSSYFEMLGEQGFPGLFLWLLLHGIGLVRMELLRRRHRAADPPDAWIAPLATALQHAQLVYLVGAVFIGIAWQPFVLMLLSVQIAFDQWVSRAHRPTARPFIAPRSVPA